MLKNIKNKVSRRLKIIEGQTRGLQRMVDDEKYCIDVIIQSSAIREALSSVENLMLENHLLTHVADQMKNKNKSKAVAEILKVYKLSNNK